MIIEGTVAPGFESVKALLEHNLKKLAERNVQLCVYVGNQRVIDLYASAIDDADFGPDSLVNVFSSGKSLEAVCLAMLAEKGLLNYDTPIASYWPEYGANNKDQTTVADLMRHEAGLAAFDTTLDPAKLQPKQIKTNAVGAVIEAQTPFFRDGVNSQREYHAMTRGWIANELFRRIEPQGRTIGEFLRSEISEPMQADAYIGLQDAELARVNKGKMLGFGYQIMQGLIPRALGRRIELNLAQSISKVARLRSATRNGNSRKRPVPISGMNNLAVFDSPEVCKAEIPSAGAKCSARGLAKIAAAMANGGSLDSTQLLSGAGWRALHEHPVSRDMMSMTTRFTQGGVATFETATNSREKGSTGLDAGLNNGREGYYGWMGLGGSIFQWHPEHKIGFAYVPTSLNLLDVVNERGKAYQAEVVRCLQG